MSSRPSFSIQWFTFHLGRVCPARRTFAQGLIFCNFGEGLSVTDLFFPFDTATSAVHQPEVAVPLWLLTFNVFSQPVTQNTGSRDITSRDWSWHVRGSLHTFRNRYKSSKAPEQVLVEWQPATDCTSYSVSSYLVKSGRVTPTPVSSF